ncbi:GTP-binding protein [Phorcysia thermohydrogeniphila]|nr:ADP-ribosylation factor-like protein [Phorcysia thermohydrogeniphila]
MLDKLLNGGEGRVVTLSGRMGRTVFFDFNPVEKKLPGGYTLRYSIYTIPGQDIYAKTREILIRGADGFVFVVDSRKKRLEANVNSMEELSSLLRKFGRLSVPLVIQYNKRDLPDALPVDVLRKNLNTAGYPEVEAVASKGIGVRETFNLIAKLSFSHFLVSASLRVHRSGESVGG